VVPAAAQQQVRPKCAAGTSFTSAWRDNAASVAFVWNRAVPPMFRAAIHEAGHLFGLSHDGLTAAAPGGPAGYWQGDANNNWAAHMG
jgi:hypothetical protein